MNAAITKATTQLRRSGDSVDAAVTQRPWRRRNSVDAAVDATVTQEDAAVKLCLKHEMTIRSDCVGAEDDGYAD